jgi:hypothetical protein
MVFVKRKLVNSPPQQVFTQKLRDTILGAVASPLMSLGLSWADVNHCVNPSNLGVEVVAPLPG